RQAVLAFLVSLLEILAGNLDPARALGRQDRNDDHFAIFGRAELRLVLLEIFRQHLGGRSLDLAGLGAVEQHIVDGALLILEAIGRLDHRGGRNRGPNEGSNELLAQHGAALLRHIALLGKAGAADQLLEALAVELAAWPLEARILHDALGDLGIGHTEPQLPDALVEQDLAENLLRDLAVDPEHARLFERDHAPDLTPEV